MEVAWPRLHCLDLSWWLPMSSQDLVPFLTHLQHVKLPGCIPLTPMPELRVLELTGRVETATHRGFDEGEESGVLSSWSRLPELLPRLEVLRAPWIEDPRDKKACSEMEWKSRQEQLAGSVLSDKCLEPLCKMKHLKELDLSGVHTLTDSGLQILADVPALQVLRLQNMGYSITSLQAFVKARAPLRLIDLGDCIDTGRRPHHGRTALSLTHVNEIRRQLPMTEVLVS